MKLFSAMIFFTAFVAAAADTNEIPPLIPAYGEIPTTFWELHKVAVIIGVFLFLAAQSFILWKLMMRLQPTVEPMENLTRAALTRLLKEPEDGNLLSEVARIVRGYFGRQFQTPGEAATTAEFIAGLERNEKISGELKQKVAGFLCECDARKFSPASTPKEIEAAERALELVNAAEQWRAKTKPASA